MKSVLAITVQLLILLLHYVNGDEVTLTTAMAFDDIIMKPTTLHGRIAVDIDKNSLLTTVDIFNRLDAERRSSKDNNIWNWDYWCQLQPGKGDCSKIRNQYYYNSQLDQCLTFTYSGCKGNKNNFNTLLECERHCKGAAFMRVKNITKLEACSLQPNAGQCVALFNKFYYDVNEGTCKSFIYGGCGGNENRFTTKRKCLRKCRDVVKSVEDMSN